MTPLPFSIVIATHERPEELRRALDSVAASTRQPARVLIVDSSRTDAVSGVAGEYAERLPLRHLVATEPSAAMQRNQGAADIATPLVVFMDDDAVLRPDTLAKMCAPFDSDPEEKTGGVAGRIDDMQHPVPRGLLWWYYRLQAGYGHPDYGGKLFGPGINCLPCYRENDPELIPSEWLNSTCVAYRTSVFRREQFPAFRGYSFMEDVHLSSRVGRTHALFFHRDALYAHRSAGSEFKSDAGALAHSRVAHQRALARDVLGRRGPWFEFQFFLHRVFSSISILRGRGPGCWQEILGTWT